MSIVANDILNLIKYLREKTKSFIYSAFYPVILGLIVLLFWISDLQMIGLYITILSACFILLIFDDFLAILPSLFLAPMCFRNTLYAFNESLVFSVVIFSLFVLSLIAHFIIYPLKKPKFDSFFFMALFVFIMFLFCGIFTKYFSLFNRGLHIILIAGLCPFIIHFFFLNKIKISSDFNAKKYFCICLISAISIAALEMLFAFLHIQIYGFKYFSSFPSNIGWINTNGLATLLLVAIPLSAYMLLDSDYPYLWLIEIIFLYICTLISNSDGCLGALLALTPILLLMTYQHVHKKNLNFIKITYAVLFSILIVAFSYIYLFVFEQFISDIKSASSGSGREHIYLVAISVFERFPIFGAGLGGGDYFIEEFEKLTLFRYSRQYHSTFFHILSCCGIIGIIVYIAYYVFRFRYLAKGNSVLGKFAILSFVLYSIYGIIDTCEFSLPLIYMTTAISVISVINKKDRDDNPLPLLLKNIKF